MNRPGPSEFRQCNCNNQGRNNPSSRYPRVREENEDNENVISQGGRCPSFVNVQGNGPALDGQTLNTISSFRQRACRFLQSESESSGSGPSHPNPDVNQYRSSNVLRQANDLIDYVPQSEFLRRMKQQCQYLQNNQPNIFSTLDNCEAFTPYECQRCIERAKLLLTLGNQHGCNRYNQSSEDNYQSFPSNQPFRRNNLEDNQMFSRDAQQFCHMDDSNDNRRLPREPRIMPKGTLDRISEDLNERLLQKSSTNVGDLGGSEKKSEHMSRSKKPAKCRGRRKRKPDSLEKCESEEEFQPNLKKPHENSCERCWRYASPLRSPVNKPEQRYDPNFRRGHSCVDLNQERGDGDLDIVGKRVSPFRDLDSTTNREKVPAQAQSTRQKTQLGQQASRKIQTAARKEENQDGHNSSFTKVKELMYNYSQSKSPEQKAVKSHPCQCPRRSEVSQGILLSESTRKPRPKSCTAGDRDLHIDGDLDTTDYYDLCTKPRQDSDQCDASRNSVRMNGHKIERPVWENRENTRVRPTTAGTPVKVNAPSMSHKSGPTPRGSSTPKKNYSKTSPPPVHLCAEPGGPSGPSAPYPKEPVSGSPKTPMNLNLSKLPGSDSTIYNEICTKNNEVSFSPKKSPAGQPQQNGNKSPSPRTNTRDGNSPRKDAKTPPNASPERFHCSSDFIENLSPILEERPRPVFARELDRSQCYGGRNEQSPNAHPIQECFCPPCAPFFRKLTNNPAPDHLLCCHCQWATNMRNESRPNQNSPVFQPNAAPNERPCFRMNEPNARQFVNEQTCRAPDRRPFSSSGSGFQKNFNAFGRADDTIECPYQSFQREKKTANEANREADCVQNPREHCRKNPAQFACQVTTRMDPQFSTSENFPTKYALFYMTQNKQDKGDDVEVLVEELTQACPNSIDPRTKDITDKMKRIMECPSDSMALRFQKGVSESCKTPRSSRVLYF